MHVRARTRATTAAQARDSAIAASGIAVQQFVSTAPSLFEPYKDEDIHGGPPLVFIPAYLSKSGEAYFLGIFHFFKVWRLRLIVVWCGVCATCVGRNRGLSLLLAASLTHAAMNTHATTHPQTFGDGHTKVKVYHHYAYRVEAEPPLQVRAPCARAVLLHMQQLWLGVGVCLPYTLATAACIDAPPPSCLPA
jgi:hypothetical protein